jgi:hypothetical protein
MGSALAAALLALTASSHAAPTYDLNLGVRHEDNLTRAEAAADQEQDTAVNAGSRVSGRMRLGPIDAVTWELGWNATWWTRFSDLSEIAGDAGLRYRHTVSTDFGATWLEGAINLGGLKTYDSAIRDGGTARAGLTTGRRFGTRGDGRVGYAYNVRRAIEDDVFDLETHEVFGQFDLTLAPRWLAYVGITAREGELVSSATVPNAKILSAANEVSEDFDSALGFGRAPVGAGRNPRRTYQIDGVVLDGEIGINYLLASGVALDLSAGYVEAHAAGDNLYNGARLNLNLLWQLR